jgi:hypothetical protein
MDSVQSRKSGNCDFISGLHEIAEIGHFWCWMQIQLPPPTGQVLSNAVVGIIESNPSFLRVLNRDLRSVLQRTCVFSLNGPVSTLFTSTIPHALDTCQ